MILYFVGPQLLMPQAIILDSRSESLARFAQQGPAKLDFQVTAIQLKAQIAFVWIKNIFEVVQNVRFLSEGSNRFGSIFLENVM